MVYKGLYLILLIISCFVYHQDPKLLCVIDVNRHGDRTPKQFLKFTSRLFYKASLTINGYQNLLLGRWFIERYILNKKFLNEKYNAKEVLFRSSSSAFNTFSGTGFIQGLYPNYIIKPIFNKEKRNLRNDIIPPINNFKLNKKNKKKSLSISKTLSRII